MTIVQLDAAALHAAARNPDSLTPDAFRHATSAVREAEKAYRAAIQARNALTRDARAINVPYTALERWTGINARTLHDIVNEAS